MFADTRYIPKLATPCTAPLNGLAQHFLTNKSLIEDWFKHQWQLSLPPVYGSVDLRNAGFKLAPIDMNLFPAGFNNLNPNFLSLAANSAKNIIEKIVPQSKKILLIPENHTRNLLYWANIKILKNILEKSNFQVKLGILSDEISTPLTIEISPTDHITIDSLMRKDNRLVLDEFEPDLILLNNDLSSGIPAILQNIEQPILPPAELGWSQRLKSEHFNYYANVTDEFAHYLGFDSWLISPLFRHCGNINFMQQEGMDCLIENAEILFKEIQKKYDEYQISHQPFLIVKADAGTYGMAVMTVRNVNELKSLNRKQRTRMSTTKGNQSVDRVIIQEGVYTFETIGPDNAVAEPVVYLWGNQVVGGFYRVHQNRGVDENLNAPGMKFEPLAFSQNCNEPCSEQNNHLPQNCYYLYGIVAKLSMLAAAREIKDQKNQGKS